jgi:alginate O-acetyltransferase complex protein AlgI
MSSVVVTIPREKITRPVFHTREKSDPRLERARPDLYRFLILLAQLVLLLGVIRLYRVEQSRDEYLGFSMFCVAFGAFAIHYWLPFAWKEKFWVAVSLFATVLFLPWSVAIGIVGVGAAVYLILASPLAYWLRATLVVSGLLAAMLVRGSQALFARLAPGHLMLHFWPVLGGIFMFRLIVYLYDIKEMPNRPPLIPFLAYFFILPNYFFPLFPVVDYKTMRLGYFRRDIHQVAQRGITWICRGTVQLLLYPVIHHLWELLELSGVRSFPAVVATMFLTFMLYLHVSGYFHVSVGILLLFGYDLPETNNKYLLSHSLTDFWRRINIYWKDFMVKIVYFPTYFRLRKEGDFPAKMVATAMVFVVTWALHSYQTFWLSGHFVCSWPDTLFWTVLGLLVMVNVWWEERHPRRRPTTGGWERLRTTASVLGTMTVILTLWSLWNAPSLTAWVDFLTWWRPRG